MMAHHLVRYVQHVRRELLRATQGMSDADMTKRVAGINSVAWMIGHLAMQEQSYWYRFRGQDILYPELDRYRGPYQGEDAPEKVHVMWQQVTTGSNPYLEGLTPSDLLVSLGSRDENIGSLLTRVIGHYYFHIGQISAVRKILGYDVPGFVGSQEGAYYQSEVS